MINVIIVEKQIIKLEIAQKNQKKIKSNFNFNKIKLSSYVLDVVEIIILLKTVLQNFTQMEKKQKIISNMKIHLMIRIAIVMILMNLIKVLNTNFNQDAIDADLIIILLIIVSQKKILMGNN